MSTEFNPMEDLLADLLSTWDEEPAAEIETEADTPVVLVEACPEPLTPSSPAPPPMPALVPGELPRISALLKAVVREPAVIVAEPAAFAAEPATLVAEPAAPSEERADVPVTVEPPVIAAVPEPEPEPVREVIAVAIAEPVPTWQADPGAAAACAAILARMEREFAEREPISLMPRSPRLASDTPRYVVFAVREMMFAVPIGRVLETDRMTPVTPLPGAAPGVKGLTNLRGEVVPVIDLRDVLGWAPPENPTSRRMIVIHDGSRQPLAALLVDQVKGLAAFPATAWKSTEMAGAHAAEGFVEAVAERELEWVSRLNLDRILVETHLPSLAAA